MGLLDNYKFFTKKGSRPAQGTIRLKIQKKDKWEKKTEGTRGGTDDLGAKGKRSQEANHVSKARP